MVMIDTTRLPRIPEDEWESKRRPDEEVMVSSATMVDGKMVDDGPATPMTMPGGLYLEDIIIWHKEDIPCDEEDNRIFVTEPDGTHGTVCGKCGGVTVLG